ncbi:alpha-amylase family glycosyl hydrolase [Actinoplanes teichomyceticus]|uniref:Alpha-glucosidase n=1 Tax=Actinoplanes teichomyceticus TaxID=1867 RepID=A0A561WLG1_ACTTI|nr:alpha-amylase family glycosyl hydrolase [Actinoplanes teichomyceticus]TWG24685.1 alpha-glucosidase [Actinoplanes teichomyceticus]GIF14652.1 alpha-glucosidase [Actinoplanes teichomyceticus]
MPAAWWRDGVVYQVYPRSFADAGGDGIGDLAGLTARLGHIAGLGADAVWLTPFQPSPQADHGYDVSDYTGVDPLFGDLAGFDRMLAHAHRLGLRVLIDVVPNHCSDQHPVFRAALAGDPSARARFHFAAEPNDWPSVFGGPAWSRAPDGAWYLHLYAPEQPDWNWRDPRTAPFFDDVLRFWFDRGVDGLRVDVAHGLFKASGLPPLPPGTVPEPGRLRGNPFACDQPEVIGVYRRWRAVADAYDPPRALIGEVNLAPERAARYVGPDRLHQAFAFAFLTAPWDAEAWRAAGERQLRHPPVTWVVENHDVVRARTRYGSPARARAALLTVLGLPGAAYLYQGQEYALPEVDVPAAARQDPAWRRGGLSRDGCRVPLPWRRDPAGAYGFSPPGAAPPWLPVPPGWGEHLDSPALPLCRRAVALRRRLHAAGALTADDPVEWSVGPDARLTARRPGLTLVVAMGAGPVPLPPGEVLLTSDPLTPDGRLPADAAAWLTPATPG